MHWFSKGINNWDRNIAKWTLIMRRREQLNFAENIPYVSEFWHFGSGSDHPFWSHQETRFSLWWSFPKIYPFKKVLMFHTLVPFDLVSHTQRFIIIMLFCLSVSIKFLIAYTILNMIHFECHINTMDINYKTIKIHIQYMHSLSTGHKIAAGSISHISKLNYTILQIPIYFTILCYQLLKAFER